MQKISSIFKTYFVPPVMAISLEDLRRMAKSIVHLVSSENSDANLPLRINSRQCELLAKKASEALLVVDEFEGINRHQERLVEGPERGSTPDWTLAATELHRVLKDAEVLTRDCCCNDGNNWLKVEIMRGNLKETFARLLYELEWHTWLLCSLLDKTENISNKRERCDGNLRFIDNFLLSAAAKQDRESLRALLTSAHVCTNSEGVCKPNLNGEMQCLAAKLLEKLDAEMRDSSQLDRGNFTTLIPHFLWVPPGDLPKGRKLGSGNFAIVRETEWLGQKLAQKAFYNTSLDKAFKDEIAAVIGLHHPNIVHVVCCSEAGPEDSDLEESDVSIVMELMYKSLYALLHKDFSQKSGPPFSIVQAVDLMQQIAEGLRYLHSTNLVHRDLKSLNILVQFADPQTALGGSGRVNITEKTAFVAKIADFGLSKVKNASTMRANQTTNLGTTQWMAPEVPMSRGGTFDEEEESDRFHPKKLDVYSFGIVCYEILSGDEPFSDVPRGQVLTRVKAGLRPNLPKGIPGRLAVLIHQCWTGDPLLRPEFSAICTELRYIKGLLLQGYNFDSNIGLDFNLNLKSVKVQGPWGRSDNDGEVFCDGIFTFIKRILLHYDKGASNIWYMELEYDVNGTSLVVGHGRKDYGTVDATINIDGPSEYITQIEGSYGTSVNLPALTVVQSLTFHTNKKTCGPFGREQQRGIGETKFKSDYGRIVGFFGRKHSWLDQIGCFIAPGTITSAPLQSITF